MTIKQCGERWNQFLFWIVLSIYARLVFGAMVDWIQLLGIPADWLCHQKKQKYQSDKQMYRAWWNSVKRTHVNIPTYVKLHSYGWRMPETCCRPKWRGGGGQFQREKNDRVIKSMWKIMILEMRRPELCSGNRRITIKAKQQKAKGEGVWCAKTQRNKPKRVIEK